MNYLKNIWKAWDSAYRAGLKQWRKARTLQRQSRASKAIATLTNTDTMP